MHLRDIQVVTCSDQGSEKKRRREGNNLNITHGVPINTQSILGPITMHTNPSFEDHFLSVGPGSQARRDL